jgi:CheY-specific phosphatase CheX
MMKRLKKAMTDSISEVLETMFFLSNEVSDGQQTDFLASAPESMRICRIDFSGPISGSFFVYMPMALLKTLTENFLGQDQKGLLETHFIGTIQEITNMAAGNTFSKFDAQTPYDFSIPEIIDKEKIEAVEIFLQVETMEGFLGIGLIRAE